MSRYPQLRSASIPALWAVQRHYGWCTPEGIRQAAAVMGVTPAYLESVASFYDLFATEPVGRHRVLVCTNISCWMRGGDELLESFCEAAGADHHEAAHHGASSRRRRVLRQGLRVPRRLRPRADGLDRRALLRPARRRRRGRRDRGAARRRRAAAREGARRARRPPAAPSPSPTRAWRGPTLPETRVLFRHIDEPGLATLEGYREPRRLQGARARLHGARARRPARQLRGLGPARPRRRRLLDGQEGLLPAPRRDAQVRLLQRRRVRARRVQGPRADDEEPAPADRGGRDRGARGRRRARVHLHPRRVLGDRRRPRPRRRRGLRGQLPGPERARHRAPRSSSSSTAAPAPTSAARRRRCSTRSRASAATRG